MDKVCILIPAYNAQNTLGGVLEKARPLQIDTIVVNDGSSDETRRIAGEFGARILEHPFNLGKGGALRTGFRYALDKGYEIVITLDADGQHDPSEIPSLLRAFESVKPDILIGSRAEEFGRMPFLRRFWNRLGVRAVARLCHSDITDSQSGYRLIRTEVLEEIESDHLTVRGGIGTPDQGLQKRVRCVICSYQCPSNRWDKDQSFQACRGYMEGL